jgi:hypothetical protein
VGACVTANFDTWVIQLLNVACESSVSCQGSLGGCEYVLGVSHVR